MKTLPLLVFLFTAAFSPLLAQSHIKVHFLYGSKPQKAFRNSEPKWFGGLHGGHVGIEYDSNKVFHFTLKKSFQWLPHSGASGNSQFVVQSVDSFYAHFGHAPKEVKKAVVNVPITPKQYQTLVHTIHSYLSSCPYDYALVGMRCASATAEVLQHIGVLQRKWSAFSCMKYPYPKSLRCTLFHMAQTKGWHCEIHAGTESRKWEKDRRYATLFKACMN